MIYSVCTNRPGQLLLGCLVILCICLTAVSLPAEAQEPVSQQSGQVINCDQDGQTGDSNMDCQDTAPDSQAEQEAGGLDGSLTTDNRNEASLAIAENTQDASLLRDFLQDRRVVFFGRLEGEFALYDIQALQGEDALDLRRFRVGVAGIQPWWQNLSYKFELDLGSGEVIYSSMYFNVDGGRRGMLTFGNQDVTQNLSANTGSLSQLFMEAPLPVTSFSLSQRLSISYDLSRKRSYFHAMVFGKDPNSKLGDYGVAARAVYSPYRSEKGIWHIGGSVVLENVDTFTRLSSRPESHVTDIRLLDTGNYYDVDERRAYSTEWAGASGPFTGRLELFRTDWKRTGGQNNTFRGAYWEAGYFLTGQHYRYRLGKFIRPELSGTGPAWELGFRLSWTDLNDGDVNGGEQRNAGFALNMYPRANIRGQFNLIQVNSDKKGGDGLLVQARIQLNW
jgi:phosphate-selective porin OprO/OprP